MELIKRCKCMFWSCFMLAMVYTVVFPLKVEAAIQEFSVQYQSYGRETLSDEEEPNKTFKGVKSETQSNVWKMSGTIARYATKIVLSGELPDDTAEISEIVSSLDYMLPEPQINYEKSEGKKAYTVTYRICETQEEFEQKFNDMTVLGSWIFDFKIKSEKENNDFLVVIEGSKRANLTSTTGISTINMVDANINEIQVGDSEFTSLGKQMDKYKIISVNSKMNKISFMVNRKQGDLDSFGKGSEAGEWTSVGCNWLSVNGGKVQRFNACSRQGDGYYSPEVKLKKGYNLVNLYFIYGSAIDKINNIWLPFPTEGASISSSYFVSIPYIIYFDGEESTDAASSNANLKSLDPLSWTKEYSDEVESYSYELNDDTATVMIPKNAKYNKFLLGILPEAGGATVKVDGVEKEQVCGNYYVVNLDSDAVEKTADGDAKVKVHVTAPDGETTKDYTVTVSRKSSEAKLKGLDIEGAELQDVENLSDALKSGEDSFIIKLKSDKEKITFKNIEVSDSATYTVNGKKVEGDSISVDPGDITRIEVTAESGLTKQLYLFLHETTDGTLPYFTISQESKDTAKQMLEDSGWYKRSEEETRSLGDAWGVYKDVATGISLDGANIDDIRSYQYTQPSDYGKNILELVMMGENPYNYTDQNGNCIVTYLEEHWDGPWANDIWALMGLKAAGAKIPDKLVTTVINMAANKTFDLDMRSWALGAISDMVPKTQLASLAEGFRNTLLTEGEEAGMFYNNWYKLSNSISHGCVLEGMSAAGIDVDKQFAVSDTASPLKTLKKYIKDNGFLYDLDATETMWAKDAIIGLGDIVNGDNVWKRAALTSDKYEAILKTAKECYGEDGSSITDEAKREALKTAYDAAKTAFEGAKDMQGIGKEYYDLYEALAAIDTSLVGKPQVRVCSWDESKQVDAAISAIDKVSDLETATEEDAAAARTAFDALSETLQVYVTNQEKLPRAESYLAFAKKADAVGTVTIESKDAIVAAEEAYQNLSDSLKAETLVQTKYALLQNQRSVYDVLSAIEALPDTEKLTLADRDAVAKAQASYDALDGELKAQITNAAKLKDATKQISMLEKAKAVEEKIDALPSADKVSFDTDAVQVNEAYQAYQALSDAEKALVTNAQKLTDVYEAMKQQMSDAEKVQEVIDNIAALPEKDALTLADEALVKNVRALYEALSTDELKARVTNLDKLKEAENQLSAIRKNDLLSLIQALPEKDEVSGSASDGSDIKLTKEQLSDIAEAKAAYDALTKADKKIFENENPKEAQKLKDLDEIAKLYDSYVEQVLAPLVESIRVFELPVSEYNRGEAGDLLTKYEAKEEAKTYLDSITWTLDDGSELALKDKMADLKTQLTKVNQDLADAAEVDAMIESLPETVDASNAESVEKALSAINVVYKKLNEQAQSYVKYIDKWNNTESMLDSYKEKSEKAAAVTKALKEAADVEGDDLLSEDTIVAIKGALARYDALLSDEQAMVSKDALDAVEETKKAIADAKKKANEKNDEVTFNGEIAWDTVISIERLAQSDDVYGTLKEKMDSDKKATIQKAFTVEAYQVLEDGSHKALELSEGLNFTVHTGNDLTGKTVVVAVQGKDAVEYVEGSVKGEDVTFTIKEASAFAVGAVAAQNNNNNGGDNNKNNSNINNGNTNNNSANKSNSTATNKSNGSTGSASGSNKSTGSANAANNTAKSTTGSSTGGSAGVPKTGDEIPVQTAEMAALALMGSALLVLCLKKKGEQN